MCPSLFVGEIHSFSCSNDYLVEIGVPGSGRVSVLAHTCLRCFLSLLFLDITSSLWKTLRCHPRIAGPIKFSHCPLLGLQLVWL